VITLPRHGKGSLQNRMTYGNQGAVLVASARGHLTQNAEFSMGIQKCRSVDAKSGIDSTECSFPGRIRWRA
jgi:hypothetical protein